MSATHYLPAARQVAQVIPDLLAQRGLKPFISRLVLTETERGAAWLFMVLETPPQGNQEDYTSADVSHYLSTALHGLPVVICNSYGLCYAVLLNLPNILKGPD